MTRLEADEARFIAELREHDVEVALYGGRREWLHRKCGMTYEEIDEYGKFIKNLVDGILKEIHKDV